MRAGFPAWQQFNQRANFINPSAIRYLGAVPQERGTRADAKDRGVGRRREGRERDREDGEHGEGLKPRGRREEGRFRRNNFVNARCPSPSLSPRPRWPAPSPADSLSRASRFLYRAKSFIYGLVSENGDGRLFIFISNILSYGVTVRRIRAVHAVPVCHTLVLTFL